MFLLPFSSTWQEQLPYFLLYLVQTLRKEDSRTAPGNGKNHGTSVFEPWDKGSLKYFEGDSFMLELTGILLPYHPDCWHYREASPHPAMSF